MVSSKHHISNSFQIDSYLIVCITSRIVNQDTGQLSGIKSTFMVKRVAVVLNLLLVVKNLIPCLIDIEN